ncbi:MAG: hypothetical protein H6822_32145 [Planctomycetaceae bacterium]|nr:hypothetical protein [Planctomycetales bacterium]MCB9926836.1 hypothetical protein [Planctomycetaceae bacterium]
MHLRHLSIILSLCFATTGCATLAPGVGDVFSVSKGTATNDLKNSGPDNPELSTAADVPSFVVEMRGSNNESQKFTRPLTDDATYVQNVLVQSRALKHFGRVKMELWRLRPDGQGYHKLDVPFDRKKKMVPPGYDYAIHEGDRLVFMEDESNILDDMLESITR